VSIFADPIPEPREQQCRGQYLYGAGFYAREDRQVGILRGEYADASFCRECPIRIRCETEHRERVGDRFPEEVRELASEIKKMKRRGGTALMVEVTRRRAGNPSPFERVALENYQRGASDRRRRDGSPLLPKHAG
jgi:hypothetical protein